MLTLWKALILFKDEYDLKGYERSHKAHLANSFSFINRFWFRRILKTKYDLRWHMTPFKLWRGCAWLSYFYNFWSYKILNYVFMENFFPCFLFSLIMFFFLLEFSAFQFKCEFLKKNNFETSPRTAMFLQPGLILLLTWVRWISISSPR